jgi:uncharacterized protein YbaA (DUF1428 family)
LALPSLALTYRAQEDPKAMPFDAKRMIYGGFKVLLDV